MYQKSRHFLKDVLAIEKVRLISSCNRHINTTCQHIKTTSLHQDLYYVTKWEFNCLNQLIWLYMYIIIAQWLVYRACDLQFVLCIITNDFDPIIKLTFDFLYLHLV